jgi:sulfite reductase (NADPH) flavoprotein alpha-component
VSYRRIPAMLRFPDHSTPVILVGPGTGIAPFRAYLNERVVQSSHGSFSLYFGCRYLDKDNLYSSDLERYRKHGQVFVAASREQSGKRYVQHVLKENGADVWRTLSMGGYIMVCG